MEKIIQIPIANQQTIQNRLISKDEALENIMHLSWANPRAFFTLQANCLSEQPIRMDGEVRAKLGELGLINDFGYSPLIVCSIMHTISERTLMVK